jgi:hypothetical protein
MLSVAIMIRSLADGGIDTHSDAGIDQELPYRLHHTNVG